MASDRPTAAMPKSVAVSVPMPVSASVDGRESEHRPQVVARPTADDRTPVIRPEAEAAAVPGDLVESSEERLRSEPGEQVEPEIDPLTSPLSDLGPIDSTSATMPEPVPVGPALEPEPIPVPPISELPISDLPISELPMSDLPRSELPIRVPAAPDVPEVPDDDAYDDEGVAEAIEPENPELTRIATRLRHDEVPSAPPDDLDVSAVLEAVRGVPGVANAHLRGKPGGMHTLRLDLADGADPGRVSRQVARLLKERMGLAAEPRRTRPTSSEPLVNAAASTPIPPMTGAPIANPQVRPSEPPPLFPRPRPATLSDVAEGDGRLPDPLPRIVVDQVRVSTLGSEATVEVRLATGGVPSVGAATGPAVDGYLLRLAAQAAASAIDGLIEASPAAPPVRCFIDHAGVVPFGSCVVAVVVVLVSGAGWVEQLVGSAIVAGDPRQAIVRATLAAMNRRLESLLA